MKAKEDIGLPTIAIMMSIFLFLALLSNFTHADNVEKVESQEQFILSD